MSTDTPENSADQPGNDPAKKETVRITLRAPEGGASKPAPLSLSLIHI